MQSFLNVNGMFRCSQASEWKEDTKSHLLGIVLLCRDDDGF